MDNGNGFCEKDPEIRALRAVTEYFPVFRKVVDNHDSGSVIKLKKKEYNQATDHRDSIPEKASHLMADNRCDAEEQKEYDKHV